MDEKIKTFTEKLIEDETLNEIHGMTFNYISIKSN